MQVRVKAKVARKQAELPRFVVVPASALAAWNLGGTTTVQVVINKVSVEPRTVKRWGKDLWFLTITERDCRTLGIDTGSKVEIALDPMSQDLPLELQALLDQNAHAAESWARITQAQRRMVRDHVAAAKQTETRSRRARRALLAES